MQDIKRKTNTKEGVLTLEGIDKILQVDKDHINEHIDKAIKSFKHFEILEKIEEQIANNPLKDVIVQVVVRPKIGEQITPLDTKAAKRKLNNTLAASLYNTIAKTHQMQHTIVSFFAGNPDVLKCLPEEELKSVAIIHAQCEAANKQLGELQSQATPEESLAATLEKEIKEAFCTR